MSTTLAAEAGYDWQTSATCRQVADVELFFPPVGGTHNGAKAVCRRCPVVAECLDYIGSIEGANSWRSMARFGVWGGMSPRERARYFGRPQGSST